MGLFSSKPQEQTEWAGLPSEPFETNAPEISSVPDSVTSVGISDTTLGSILIPVAVPLPEHSVVSQNADPNDDEDDPNDPIEPDEDRPAQ